MTETMTKERTKLPKFEGKPLIEIPEFTPQAGFLEGEFGKAFLEEYNRRVDTDYNGNKALNVLKYDSGVVKGSNPFAVVLANQILREEGLRTATQADLEKALRMRWDLRGTYEDTSLVLRSEKDEDYAGNTPLAKNLGSQLKARGIKFSSKNPIMIPLTELELEKADNSYGLTFKLKEDAEFYEAPILRKGGRFNSEDVDEKIGLPTRTGDKGNRFLYTRDSGLSWLFLDFGLGLGSCYRSLGYLVDVGRVVVVSGEATRDDLEKYIGKLRETRDEGIAELNERYRQAEAILRGK